MAQAVVRINDNQADAELIEEWTADLYEELLHAPVEQVERPPVGSAPRETRGGELVELATVILQVAADSGALKDLIGRLSDWRSRQTVQSIEVKIANNSLKLSGASPEQQRALVEHFIRATTGPDRQGPCANVR